jgi:hypothetical protein
MSEMPSLPSKQEPSAEPTHATPARLLAIAAAEELFDWLEANGFGGELTLFREGVAVHPPCRGRG